MITYSGQAFHAGGRVHPTITAMIRTTAIAVSCLAAAAFSACGSDDPPETPTACLGPARAYLSALATAPDPVRLADGTPIGACLIDGQAAGPLAQVGEAMVAAATELNRRVRDRAPARAAVELGYLVGAAEDAGSATGGIHRDLVLRLESAARYGGTGDEPLPESFERAFEVGYAAGRSGA
jgi:hypothetical protein